MDLFVVLPDQLFYTTYALKALTLSNEIWILEEPDYFKDVCRSKLTLHRASMKYYYDLLKRHFNERIIIKYINRKKIHGGLLGYLIAESHGKQINMFLPSIHEYKNITKIKINGLPINFYDSPGFLLNYDYITENYKPKTGYQQTSFYKKMRKLFTPKLNPKIKGEYAPVGGKWTFDEENRKTWKQFSESSDFKNYSAQVKIYSTEETDKLYQRSKKHIDDHYPYTISKHELMSTTPLVLERPVEIMDNTGWGLHYRYPITHAEAELSLDNFIKKRLKNFGPYQDTMYEGIGFHSGLSASLNIGLLTPLQVLTRVMEQWPYDAIESFEGFIRQLIGWREFMHMMYIINPEISEWNHFENKRKIPPEFYAGNTQIPVLNLAIKEVHSTGYLHHIKRLMLVGNSFLAHGFAPKEVYKWFMLCFIDSYPWVMWPNIAMSQYHDGGLIASSLYISSSKYIKKMGPYDVPDLWNILYFNFIAEHREQILKIYGGSWKVSKYDSKTQQEKYDVKSVAEKYLAILCVSKN